MLVFAVYSNGNTWLTTDLSQLQAKLQSERGLIDRRIDQLEPDPSIEGSELVPVFQDGQTRKVTIDQILDEAEDRITQGSTFRRKVELTESRSLLPTDIGCHLFYSGATPITITIPDNIFVDPQQDLIDVEIAQLGTGVITIVPGDVTMNGGSDSISLTQNKSIVLVFYSSDTLNVLSSGVSDSDPRLSDARPASSASDNAIGDRTADPSQTPSGNTGKLTQWLSWLTNRIKAITGKTNWYDAPDITLSSTKTRLDDLDTTVASKLTVTGTPTSGQIPKFNGSIVAWSNDGGGGSSAWTDITGKPTTLSGYGITDAVSSGDSRLTDARSPLAGTVSLTSLASGFSLPWSQVGSTPTTIAGYGITDAVNTSDSRLTNARTPLAHEQAWTTITGDRNFPAQGSSPAVPASGFTLFADSANRLSWEGTNGRIRTFDGTVNTADRVYTLPDASGAIAFNVNNSNTATFTLSGLTTDFRYVLFRVNRQLTRTLEFQITRQGTEDGGIAGTLNTNVRITFGGDTAPTIRSYQCVTGFGAINALSPVYTVGSSATVADEGIYVRLLGGRTYTVSGLPSDAVIVTTNSAGLPAGVTALSTFNPGSDLSGQNSFSSVFALAAQGLTSILFGTTQSTSTSTGTLRLLGTNAGIGLSGNIFGGGLINMGGTGSFGTSVIMRGASFNTTQSVGNLTANRTITTPDRSGVITVYTYEGSTVPSSPATNETWLERDSNGIVVALWVWDGTRWSAPYANYFPPAAQSLTGVSNRVWVFNNPGYGTGIHIRSIALVARANTTNHSGSAFFSFTHVVYDNASGSTNVVATQNTQSVVTTSPSTRITATPGSALLVTWDNLNSLGTNFTIGAGSPSMNYRVEADIRVYR